MYVFDMAADVIAAANTALLTRRVGAAGTDRLVRCILRQTGHCTTNRWWFGGVKFCG
jgi:hypothetical protein